MCLVYSSDFNFTLTTEDIFHDYNFFCRRGGEERGQLLKYVPTQEKLEKEIVQRTS